MNGFKTTGLWPVDKDIFSDEEFAAALMTDEPEPDMPGTGEGGSRTPETGVEGQEGEVSHEGCAGEERVGDHTEEEENVMRGEDVDDIAQAADIAEDIVKGSEREGTVKEPESSENTAERMEKAKGAKTTSKHSLITELSPLPKAEKRKRVRKPEKAMVLTSPPNKQALLQKEKKSEEGKQTKLSRKTKGKPQKTKQIRKNAATDGCSSGDAPQCFICDMRYSMSCEDWIKCTACERWACIPCTDVEPGQMDYVCDMCR